MTTTEGKISLTMLQYDNIDRSIIKRNLKRLMAIHGFKPVDIMALGFAKNNVYAWSNSKARNIPMFNQALRIANHYEFSVEEFIKNIYE